MLSGNKHFSAVCSKYYSDQSSLETKIEFDLDPVDENKVAGVLKITNIRYTGENIPEQDITPTKEETVLYTDSELIRYAYANEDLEKIFLEYLMYSGKGELAEVAKKTLLDQTVIESSLMAVKNQVAITLAGE